MWVAALLVLCLGWTALRQTAQAASRQSYPVEWRSAAPTWSLAQARQMQRREEERARLEGASDRFVLWDQLPGQKFTGSGEEVSGSLVPFFGESRSWLGQTLLDGEWLSTGDEEGCLITRELAWGLFGSQQVTGLTVETPCGPRVVRGVLESGQPVLLCHPVPDQPEETVFSSVTLLLPGDTAQPDQLSQAFALRHSLPEGVACLRYGMTARAAGALWRLLLLGMLLWIFGLEAVWKTLPQIWQRRGAFWLLLGGGLLLVFWGIRFPAAWVPTRWSDFSFWQRTASDLGESLRALLAAQTLFPTAPAAAGVLSAAGWLLSSLAALLVWSRSGRRLSAGPALRLSAVVLVAGAVSLATGQGLWSGGFALLLLLLALTQGEDIAPAPNR